MSHSFPNFVALLRQYAQDLSDKTVFTFLQDGESVTGVLSYADLDRRARAIATTLQNLGAQGERALLLYPPGLDFVAAFFGCLYAGTVAVPAYPPRANRSMERLQAIITDAEAQFALTTGDLAPKLKGKLVQADATEINYVATDDQALGGIEAIAELAKAWRPTHPDSQQLAFLQYTSGSTGNPKGVMVSHGNLIQNSALINQGFEDGTDNQVVSWLPPYHDMGLIGGVLQPLYLGSSMIMMPPVTFLQRPIRWLQTISNFGASTSGGPNFAYELCAKQITPEQKANLDLSCWEIAFTGAEPVRAQTLDLFAEAFAECGFKREAFYPCYGMAEATLMITGGHRTANPILTTLDKQALQQRRVDAPATAESAVELVASGRPLAGQTLLIVDPDQKSALPEGQVGEIWVSGASIAQGYWKREELTEFAFQARPTETESPVEAATAASSTGKESDRAPKNFLRTGDLGFLKDQELFVTGRLKDLIIIRGRNHYPQDIEETVAQSHPDLQVASGASFSVDVDGEEQLVITQEVRRSALRKLDGETVLQAIRQAVIQHHGLQPHAILLLRTNSIPKTSSGKIQRYACRNGFLEDGLRVVAQWKAENGKAGDWTAENEKAEPGNATPTPTAFVAQPQQTANNPCQREIATWLAERLGSLLGQPAQALDHQEPMASFGLDSLRVVRLSAELEDLLDLKLSPTLVYDYPTIDSLSSYLAHQLDPASEALSEVAAQSVQPQRSVSHEEIAIIGMGCRFPGADNPQEFWELLQRGEDAIRPTQRWENSQPEWGGFLDQVDQFDPQFFGLSPREAQRMDPQQRLLMEVTWEALEQAGLPAPTLAGTATGVFMGLSSSDYSQLQSTQGIPVDAYSGTGNAHSVAANRLSYFLDLQGPSLAVDTACSSSLVALHLASQSLNQGDCSLAIAGGVNLMLSPDLTQVFRQAGMMAEDGRCKTFDAKADGYVRGEGCGVVLLKRLSDAQRDGDPILAVVKGSAINQDGRSNGLTAPNGRSQQAVIRQALAQAGVSATDIDYIEAHGTGTSLGDPIELNAIQTVFSAAEAQSDAKPQGKEQTISGPCWIGSVKTNIGHLEAAAGVAGLIKSVLSLQQGKIPPHLHLQEINPHIALQPGLAIPTTEQPWEPGQRPRLAGISSFGFGGTNAHVIVGEAPPVRASQSSEAAASAPQLLTLSAKSEMALAATTQRYRDWLGQQTAQLDLADICSTANRGRTAFEHRLAVIAQSPEELQTQLQDFLRQRLETAASQQNVISGQAEQNPSLTFLFTGQGAQTAAMGQRLYQTEPVFAQALDRCAALLKDHCDRPLLDLLYGDSKDDLNQTLYTQPALFAVEYALAQLWQSWGVHPAIVMGHSVGEYVAACVAGVFSLEDGLRLISARARLMQSLPENGGMVAVFVGPERIQSYLDEQSEGQAEAQKISIAAYNGPELVILAGERDALAQLVQQLKADGIRCRPLSVSHAFHSPLMEPILKDFEAVARAIIYQAPQIPLVSNLSGSLAGEEIASADYWVRHIRQPVQFAASMDFLQTRGETIFLELGPKPTLLPMGRQCWKPLAKAADSKSAPQFSPLWLPSLYPGQDERQQMLQSLGHLSVRGVAVQWDNLFQQRPHRHLNLPTYPFQRQRCWLDGLTTPTVGAKSQGAAAQAGAIASAASNGLTAPPGYEVVWQALPKLSPVTQDSPGRWLIFTDQTGLGGAVAQALESQGAAVTRIQRGKQHRSLGQNQWEVAAGDPDALGQQLASILDSASAPWRGILYGWGLDASGLESLTGSMLMATQTQICAPVLALIKTLTTQASAPLWMVTRGVQSIAGESSEGLCQSSLWGLGKVLTLEHPEAWGGLIDMSPTPLAGEVDALINVLLSEHPEDQIALREQAFGARLQPIPSSLAPAQIAHSATELGAAIHAEGSYLITGGLGALGLTLAEWLAEQGAKHLVLASRRSPNATQKARIEALEQRGVHCAIAALDVTDAASVTALCQAQRQSTAPLRGVIHAAGRLADGLLQGQTWAQWQQVLAPKLQGAWNLHQATEDDSLDFFLLFSSVASMLGSPGQGNYAAANAFLDSLAQLRRRQGKPAQSINWGPWAKLGMADQTRLNKGLTPLSAEQYLATLPALLTSPQPQVGVFESDWSFLLKQFPQLESSGYFSQIVSTLEGEASAPSVSSSIWQQLKSAQSEQRPEMVQDYLRGTVAHILQADPAAVTPTASLMDLGMDSLMVMEAINQLKQDLQLMIYPREFYERPRIDSLARYLAGEFEQSQGLTSTLEAESGFSQNGHAKATQSSPLQLASPAQSETKLRLVEKKAGPMAFILSSPRSGSTLLRVMLAGNPSLFSPPELHLLPFETLGDRQRQMGVSHMGEGLQRAIMELKGIDAAASRALLDELEASDAPIEEIYSLLQSLSPERLLVDKSPSYANDLANLHRAERCIDGAKYIHLVRHPYAVLESFCRMRMDKLVGDGQQSPLDLAEQIWQDSNRNTQQFFQGLDADRHHLVRYEDLVREPETVLRGLCDFLEVPFAEAMLTPYRGDRMTDGVHAQSMSLGDPNFAKRKTIDASLASAWREIELPRLLQAPSQQLAQQLAYELPREQAVAPTVGAPENVANSGEGFSTSADVPSETQLEAFAATMTEKFLSVGGSTICLCTWGPADGPLVLCLHGILEQGASWIEVAARLAAQGYRIVAPDLRGHGHSTHVDEGNSYNLMDFLADLDGIVEQITDKPFTLVGHSLGSVVGALFASVRPNRIRKLIMVETILPTEVSDDEAAQQLAAHLDYLSTPPQHPVFADVETAAERLRLATPALSKSLAMLLAKRITEPCEGGVRWRWAPLLRTRAGIGFNGINQSRYLGLLKRIRNPITLIYGDRSQFNRQADLNAQQQALAHAKRVVVSGGHNLPIDAPSAIAEAILSS